MIEFLLIWFLVTLAMVLSKFYRFTMAIYIYYKHGKWIREEWTTTEPPMFLRFISKIGKK